MLFFFVDLIEMYLMFVLVGVVLQMEVLVEVELDLVVVLKK